MNNKRQFYTSENCKSLGSLWQEPGTKTKYILYYTTVIHSITLFYLYHSIYLLSLLGTISGGKKKQIQSLPSKSLSLGVEETNISQINTRGKNVKQQV